MASGGWKAISNYLGEKAKQKNEMNSLDAMVKRAQLAESGYGVEENPKVFGGLFGGGYRGVSPVEGFQSTKQLERDKLSTENEMNRMKLDRMQNSFGGGQTPSNMRVETYDEYGQPKTYKPIDSELSGDAATKLAGAQQVLQQAKAIRDLANEKNYKNLVSGVGKIRLGRTTGINQPGSIRGAFANYATLGQAKKWTSPTDEESKFELAVNLIAENLLRARTGAAAPTPEQIREEARQLLSNESFNAFLHRIVTSEQFARNVGSGIRPGSKEFLEDGGGASGDPLEAEAQQAIANGADPVAVKARLAQLRAS